MSDVNPGGEKVVSEQDVEHLRMIRANVTRFLKRVGEQYGAGSARLLDIAPQIHEGARPHFSASITVETLDINPASGATWIGDICSHNRTLPDSSFDLIVCTEVLEHVVQPFAAATELRRLLRAGGFLFVTVPFNFRIHGPLPDCWRFTEHGLRALFHNWEIIELEAMETPDRFLMPIHYTLIVKRPN
jgi:SAM-dependent methyltransferase